MHTTKLIEKGGQIKWNYPKKKKLNNWIEERFYLLFDFMAIPHE